MDLGMLGQLGMLGYSLFGGGSTIQAQPVTTSADYEQRGLLSQLSHLARYGVTPGVTSPGTALLAAPGPSTYAPLTGMQQAGIRQLGNLPLGSAMGTLGQGQQTLRRMLDPAQNMDYAMQMFQPIQDQIANRFASADGARSSGFGQALGRGFAQGVMPQIYGQQATGLENALNYASAPMVFQSQAAQGRLQAGGLERQGQIDQLLDQLRMFENRLRPLHYGLQAAGIPVGNIAVGQQMPASAMMGYLASSPQIWESVGNWQWPWAGGATTG